MALSIRTGIAYRDLENLPADLILTYFQLLTEGNPDGDHPATVGH